MGSASDHSNDAVNADQNSALVIHMRELRGDVAHRIPARFRSLIGPDDVLQEVWMKALDRPDGSIRDWKAWTRRAARSVLIDKIRAARAVKRGGDAERVQADARLSSFLTFIDRLDPDTQTPSRIIVARESHAAMMMAVNLLPALQREAIRLRYVDGLPRREVAERMGRTESVVYKLIAQALRTLRAQLQELSGPLGVTPASGQRFSA